MHRKQFLKASAITIVGALVSMQNAVAAPSLRRSEQAIHAWLLKEVPLGSSMEDVIGLIERNQWTIRHVDRTRGFYDQRTQPNKVTGAKSIRASLGDYRNVFSIANVTVYWAFDESERLTDIWVWKTYDGP